MSNAEQKSSLSALLSPVKMLGMELKNRVAMAPLTRGRSGADRIPNSIMAKYYQQRASAGLLVSEATSISEMGNGWEETPGIYTDQMVEGWKKITDAVHQSGGRIVLQLWHTGRASHSHYLDGKKPIAPSAIAIEGEGVHTSKGKLPHETPRAMEESEIAEAVSEYRRATKNAIKAGFDGVELHAANGYLVDQFLQSKSNHRTDKYGGSVENRHRFLAEIMTEILKEAPAEKAGVRLSPNGVFNDVGSPDFRDQFSYSITELEKLNLGFLHIVDGLDFGFHQQGEAITLAEIRQWFTGPLIGNCGYNAESANNRIAEGNADMIAFGRAFISNPDLVERFAAGADLNPDAELDVWYGPLGEKGYTDFPTLSAAGV